MARDLPKSMTRQGFPRSVNELCLISIRIWNASTLHPEVSWILLAVLGPQLFSSLERDGKSMGLTDPRICWK